MRDGQASLPIGAEIRRHVEDPAEVQDPDLIFGGERACSGSRLAFGVFGQACGAASEPLVEDPDRLPVERRHDMAVRVERGRDRLVTEQLLHDLGMDAGLEHDRGRRVTEIVNPNVRQSGGGQRTGQLGVGLVRLHGATPEAGEDETRLLPARREQPQRRLPPPVLLERLDSTAG